MMRRKRRQVAALQIITSTLSDEFLALGEEAYSSPQCVSVEICVGETVRPL